MRAGMSPPGGRGTHAPAGHGSEVYRRRVNARGSVPGMRTDCRRSPMDGCSAEAATGASTTRSRSRGRPAAPAIGPSERRTCGRGALRGRGSTCSPGVTGGAHHGDDLRDARRGSRVALVPCCVAGGRRGSRASSLGTADGPRHQQHLGHDPSSGSKTSHQNRGREQLRTPLEASRAALRANESASLRGGASESHGERAQSATRPAFYRSSATVCGRCGGGAST
jgi:hypothetical protein